jgi:outer membrane lipoprotein-sorting protein
VCGHVIGVGNLKAAPMKRLIALLLLLPLFAAGPAFAMTEAEALKKVEGYFNGITTLQARFLQTDSDGKTHEGDLYISRPGKMRLVYDPPTPMLLVADGTFLIYVDTQMKDASHIDLNDTPAGLLLKQNLSFSDPAVKVGGVKFGAGTVEITASMAKDPAAGKLTMVFTEQPFEFKQWRVVDAQRKEVTVAIYEAKTGVKLDKALFRYDARKPSGDRD